MRLLFALAAVSFASSSSLAQEDDGAGEPEFAAWGVVYTGEVVAGVLGGLERDAAYLHNIDLTAELRLDARAGWIGPHLYAHVLGNHGRDPSAFVGDVQAVSNIATDPAWRLFELWIEQEAFDGRASARIGLYDLNGEFDVSHTGSLFANSSFGIGPEFSSSGLNGPSIFPTTALGARVRWSLSSSVYLQGAILDGVPGDPERPRRSLVRLSERDGALVVVEAGVARSGTGLVGPETAADAPARLALGVWTYSGSFPHLLPDSETMHVRSFGAYAIAELAVAADARCYTRVGWADPRANRFVGSWVGGCTVDGLLMEDDSAGLAISTAINGNPYIDLVRGSSGTVGRAETALEAAYALTLSKYLSLQADVQFVLNPDTNPSIDDALLVGLRATVGI